MTEEPLHERTREAYEKQIFDLRQLLAVSKSLNSTLDYHILIDSILFTIMGQMKLLKAGLFAKRGLDAEVFGLHRNYKGFEIDHEIDYSVPEDHPLIKLFARNYRCYTLEEIRAQIGSLEGIEGLASLEPSLLVPLKARGTVNGIIIVGERIDEEDRSGEDFNDYEREYLLNVASLASVAINNTFLFEMTTTDMMTRLKLKHYFYTILIEKMEQAATEGRALSVLMIDIDLFKKFNDTWGHSCGDAVLKMVASVIQASIRGFDLAARYGGEEFCVLLLDAALDRGKLIAERIRSGIAKRSLDYDGRALSVTVSLGVAQYDTNRDISAKSLIDRADKALYAAKQGGRDQVGAAP